VTYHAPAEPGAELSAPTATTDASGAASVLAIADAIAGAYTATATVDGAPDVSFALTNTAASPSSVVIVSGGAQHTLATTAFTAAVRARVLDAFGNPVPGATVTFSVPATGASATMSDAMPVTDDDGYVSITLTAGPVVGPFTLSATASGALTAATTTLEALAIPTTITAMTAATSPVDVAASVTITVSAQIGVPSGTVEVLDTDGKLYGSATLAAGSATISAAGMPMGHHVLVAHYAAQGSYAESTSAPAAIDIIEDSGSLSGGGHGGCSTSGASGGWLAVVVAAVLLRRRRRALAGVVAVGLALHTGLASADAEGAHAINRYHAASPESAWFALDSASFAGDGGVALSVVTDYAKDPLETFDGDGTVREHVVTDTLTVQLGASITLRERFRLSTTVVMVPWQDGNGGTFNGMTLSSPTYAFGDMIVAGDYRLYGEPHDPLRVVAGARFALPTGSRTNFTSDGTPGIEPRLQLAGSLGKLEYAGGASAFLRNSSQMARETFGHELRYQAALGARLLDSRLFIGPELFGAVALESGTAIGTPLEAQLGAHITASRELRFGVAAGVGLINAVGEPRWRALAQLAWTP
jgi:MYXO-CTERM domain-containing protein